MDVASVRNFYDKSLMHSNALGVLVLCKKNHATVSYAIEILVISSSEWLMIFIFRLTFTGFCYTPVESCKVVILEKKHFLTVKKI